MRDVERWAQQLSSDDSQLRCQAAESLAQLGEAAQAAATALVRASDTDDDTLRHWVVAALEQLGAPADSDLPELASLLAAAELPAYWAATLLGRLQQRAVPAIGPLAQCVAQSPYPSVRQRAISALGQIGPAARSAVDVLQQAAASSDRRTARLAQQTLANLGNT